MNDLTDQQLLRDYAGERSEEAFTELVRRHIDLVYSAALRMVRDAHLAEDVTQGAFLALAQSAAQLTDRPVLSGWLHRTAQNLAVKVVRTDARRRAREQEAAAMNELLAAGSNATWDQVAPHLDAALGELSEADRDALLLRYFERKSAREMAQALGISDEAAQRRVSRAVERLRECFAKRGVTVGASGLAVAVSSHAVHAAPAGLAVTISTAAAFAATAVTTGTATATTTIAMTATQKALITATLVTAIGAGIYQARKASNAHSELQAQRNQQALLTEQVQQLTEERDEAARRVAALQSVQDRLNQTTGELLRLRGEMGRLRQQATVTAQPLENRAATSEPSSGFGVLGNYLPAENLSDAGNATGEALLQTTLWAVKQGNLERLEALGAPFGGQSVPGQAVGDLSPREAAAFQMMQDVLTNSVGFRLAAKPTSGGQVVAVRVDAVPRQEGKGAGSYNNANFTFYLEPRSTGWGFSSPPQD